MIDQILIMAGTLTAIYFVLWMFDIQEQKKSQSKD